MQHLVEALAGQRLPAALVDLDALERNVDRIAGRLNGKRCRVASKSVRHVGLLTRILERGGPAFQGLMCFTAEEAVFLAEQGFDDLLVAYPTTQKAQLEALAACPATTHVVVDCEEHLALLPPGVGAILELDVSYRRGGLHLGARRSPLRRPEQVVALARSARERGVEVTGLMAYEGHVAGLPDENPFSRAMNPVRRALKSLSVPDIARLRRATVEALRAEGFELGLVNGGGTGSVRTTVAEEVVTEVTAGSGFLCSHLFSWYRELDLEPAALFALEVCRVSDEGFGTCLGGGYVASGEPGWDRLPLPVWPEGLEYLQMEGAGEVQTPLRGRLRVGDTVLFRHAKAGELAERFDAYHLVRGAGIEATEPTYRGQGGCFL